MSKRPTSAEIIAAHLAQMRSNGGKAKAAKMGAAERKAMSERMIAAKRIKREAMGREG